MMSEFGRIPAEQMTTPEIPRSGWDTLIVLQRHGAYDNRRPADPNELEESEKAYGHLTEEGKAETKRKAEERIDAMLSESGNDTDFLVLSSPTFWLDNNQLGQRAADTADIITEVIREKLEQRDLSPDQLLNNSPRIKGEESRPDDRLVEAKMFVQAPEFVQFLREQSGGRQSTEFWNNFNTDKYSELREQHGAEGPVEIADRINENINTVARFARRYHHNNQDRRLVIWETSHGDGLEPFVQQVVGAPAEDFDAEFNAAIGIGIDAEGNATTTIKGKEYTIPLAQHGRPDPVQANEY